MLLLLLSLLLLEIGRRTAQRARFHPHIATGQVGYAMAPEERIAVYYTQYVVSWYIRL